MIDPYTLHLGQVDHDAAIADGVAGHIMATSPHRHQQNVFPRKINARDNVGNTGAAGDQRRAPIYIGVPDLPLFIITFVAGLD